MKKVLLLLVTALVFSTFGQAQTFNVDPVHTSVVFRAFHNGTAYWYGTFDETSGQIVYDAESVENSSISFEILVDSIDTNNERRTGHLLSPDFFDSAQFPTINFDSTSVVAGMEEDSLAVTGDLSIHGVTQEVTLEVMKTGQTENRDGKIVLGFHTTVDINRPEYGMTNLIGTSGEDILLMIGMEAIEQ